MNKNLTVVLPVHNAEASLHHDVRNVLEVAAELSTGLRLFILDDGSTDDTYDMAMELSARYPQIRVMHHATRQGLGSAIAELRGQIGDDLVLVHDGASPIQAEQIRRLWDDEARQITRATDKNTSIDDLRHAAATHPAMAAAHNRLAGFQRLSNMAASDDSQLTRRDQQAQKNVGVIPPLPRPNFMGALANFALGE
ncbi:glycosyltransferase family 2 protein [Aeoliella mucimassa]|uniref:Putative glycosyl transferase n=1 Tax=Aeoliella mucimassa TaxID=2527972 RepID=A0A518AVI0_9BACT|nr:glycosyltransferase [Aeoliella mucimassa]QDU58723.1 putative glycosyl transferase [Aeoliella mucimassa]